jgi:hypothetical protein
MSEKFSPEVCKESILAVASKMVDSGCRVILEKHSTCYEARIDQGAGSSHSHIAAFSHDKEAPPEGTKIWVRNMDHEDWISAVSTGKFTDSGNRYLSTQEGLEWNHGYLQWTTVEPDYTMWGRNHRTLVQVMQDCTRYSSGGSILVMCEGQVDLTVRAEHFQHLCEVTGCEKVELVETERGPCVNYKGVEVYFRSLMRGWPLLGGTGLQGVSFQEIYLDHYLLEPKPSETQLLNK